MALACLIGSAAMLGFTQAYPDNGGLIYSQGGFARIGLVLGALWLAMPSRNYAAAWANISPKFLGLLALIALVTIRIPPRILLPAALVTGIAILVLRPRPKRRPSNGAG